ncbi:hypothetical protein VB711_07110 [Cronbergia sp. UHCC 0137]|uniref:hypothetical protein n=1 Tax=Cronbergia sp. UHCC 0137 TaxID=3110239 RepID=UPI002B1F96AA|nr:hypothetical protein [Cronbergia sp. UHCC 0137]MEA5617608.1 hypothetical protein [Cronbergia sp. UHCC 0137]
MFLASAAKPIDDVLKNAVEKIEAQSPNLSVLVARQFRYNLRQNTLELTIKEPRQFNVLEEFIIRAGIEFDPAPIAEELASILGLDAVFVQSTIATLQSLQTLANKSPITVTEEGRLFYEKGTVPQPPYSVQVYAITDFLGGDITIQSESLNEVIVNLPDLAKFIKVDSKFFNISALTLEKIQEILHASDLKLHQPEEGKIVTYFKVLPASQIIWKTISVFLIFDAVKDNLSIQVRSGKKILETASSWLESLLREDKISLLELCRISNEAINSERETVLNQKNAEIESRLEKIREQVLEGSVIQLRDAQITETFLEALNSAKHQVIIYLPLINQGMIDDNLFRLLEKLVNRGVEILIGCGIVEEEIEAKLKASGIQLFCLGDSHIKEVIVDQKVYLCGAYDWLFYRGYDLPRGESVYQVKIPQQVAEAYQFMMNRFQNHLGSLEK